MERHDIYQLVENAISVNANLDDEYEIPVRMEIRKKFLGVEQKINEHINTCSSHIIRYFHNVMGWLPANPSKKEIIDAINSVYVFTDKKGTDPNNFVNTHEGHQKFQLEMTEGNDIQTFFLVGPKGSGKTFYLNYLVNTNNDYFYDNKLIWFRADISKLYKHNITLDLKQNENIDDVKYTLENYFNLHIVYVSTKYREKMKILDQFWKDKNGESTDLILDKWLSNTRFQEIEEDPDQLIKKFKSFFDSIKIEEKNLFGQQSLEKDKVKRLVWGKKAIIRNDLLAEVIIDYLNWHNYKPLLIIDGLDNINYYSYEYYYQDILAQVRALFLKDDKKNFYNSKTIISLRDETYHDLLQLSLSFFKNYNPSIFRIKTNDVEKIIRSKVDIAMKPKCSYYKQKKEYLNRKLAKLMESNSCIKENEKQTTKELISSNDKHFQSFANQFLDQMVSAIKKTIPIKYTDEDIDIMFVFRQFYNNNLRAFLNNFLNIYNYSCLFKEKKRYISSDRDYVLTEGQLLNGNLFLDTYNSQFEFGKCIPNLFWFNCYKHISKWHGLCLIRLLQLVKHKTYTENELMNMLYNLFGYPQDLAKYNIYYSISHGLMKCKFDYESNIKYFYITSKGIFLIDYELFSVDLLYFIAIDTPFAKCFCVDSKFLRFHTNEYHYWEYYIEACVITVISFIRHILTTHNNEMSKIKKSETNININIFNFTNYFPKLIIEGLVQHIMTLKKFKDTTRFEGLVHDIQNIVQ